MKTIVRWASTPNAWGYEWAGYRGNVFVMGFRTEEEARAWVRS